MLTALDAVNEEVLRVLLRSHELYPRNTERLLELNRVNICPQMLTQHLVQWRKTHDPSEDDTGLPRPRRQTCFLGDPLNYRSSLDRPNPRPLPQGLMRRYLVARMERAKESPCLLSVFIERSVDLIMENSNESTPVGRQQLFDRMVASFDIDLISSSLATKLSITLFDAPGLYYWLPFYDAAHLTTYPDPEFAFRLFLLLRIARRTPTVQEWEDENWEYQDREDEDEEPYEQVIHLLKHSPSGPEYAKLFAIDAYNVIATARDTSLMGYFCVSNAGRALGQFSVAEQIWCAAKQGKRDLAFTLLSMGLEGSLPKAAVSGGLLNWLTNETWLILEQMVRNGECTHLGRSVIEDVLKCQDVESVKAIHKDVRLEDCMRM